MSWHSCGCHSTLVTHQSRPSNSPHGIGTPHWQLNPQHDYVLCDIAETAQEWSMLQNRAQGFEPASKFKGAHRNKPDPQRPYIAICKIQRILCQCPGARPQRIHQRSFINASTGLIYMIVEPHGSDFSGASNGCSIRLRSGQFGDEHVSQPMPEQILLSNRARCH